MKLFCISLICLLLTAGCGEIARPREPSPDILHTVTSYNRHGGVRKQWKGCTVQWHLQGECWFTTADGKKAKVFGEYTIEEE